MNSSLFLFRLLSLLPLRVLHALGASLAYLYFFLSPSFRHFLRANLALALGEKRAREEEKRAVIETGKMALEVPKIWLSSFNKVVSYAVSVNNWALVEAAVEAKKGIVFLTPHFGCFEITAQYISHAVPLTVLYRTARQPWLDVLMKKGRSREHMRLAPADASGVRALIKALKRGEAIGLLPDQTPRGGEGAWLNFFGRPAYGMTLAARLLETGATPIWVIAERLPKGKGFVLTFSEPKMPLTGSLLARAQAINHDMEALILKNPNQYLWGYNRYKRPSGAPKAPLVLDESSF